MTTADSASPFRALRLHDYRWYWLSGLGTTGAQNVQRLAMAWLILDLTHSVGKFGLMIFMMGLPMSIVSLWGGVLADRYDRRNILVFSQGFTGANLLLLAFLVQTDAIAIWHVYASSVGLGAMQALTMPARQAMVRSLVGPEDMKNAVSLNSIQMQVAQVVWPFLAGGIIALIGIAATLTTSAGLSVLGIIFLAAIRVQTKAESYGLRASPLRDLIDGLRYSFSAPKVGTLMSMAIFVGLFGLPFTSIAPGYAREVLGFDAGRTGLFLMATGAGSIAGSMFVLLVHVRDNLRLYFVGSGFMGLSVAGVTLAPWPFLAFIPAGGFGFCLAVMIVGGQTLFQTEVPPNLLGRVNSVWSLVAAIGFVAALPIGFAADVFGLRAALAFCGFALALSVIANGAVRTSVLRSQRSAVSVS